MIDPGAELARDLQSPAKERVASPVLDSGVDVRLETTLEAVHANVATIQTRGDFSSIEGLSAVVAGGRIARNELFEDLRSEGFDGPVIAIGDALRPRTLYHATHDAIGLQSQVNALAPASR